MLDKDLKNLWNNAPQKGNVQFDKQKILNEMNTEIQKIDRSIRNRNLRETFAALLVILMFGWSFFTTDVLISKIGMGAVVLGAAFIIYKLYAVRKSRQPVDVSTDVKTQLVASRDYLKKEQNLLQNVLYWYILPLAAPILFIGIVNGSPLLFKVIYSLFVIGLSFFVYWLNQKAAKGFDPNIAQLEEAIEKL